MRRSDPPGRGSRRGFSAPGGQICMESGEGVSSSAGLKQSIAQLQPDRQGQTGLQLTLGILLSYPQIVFQNLKFFSNPVSRPAQADQLPIMSDRLHAVTPGVVPQHHWYPKETKP